MSERRTRITCVDIDSGESETTEIGPDQFIVICGSDRYVANEQLYPKAGTNVVTIKSHP